MQKLKVGVLVIAGYVTSWALVPAYHVEPRTAGQSGWTKAHPVEPGDQYVSQVVTVCFDEIDSAAGCYVELFVGSKCTEHQYYLTILTYPGGSNVASAFGDRSDVDHKWVRFKPQMYAPDSVVRGKKLEFRFTRGGGDDAAA